MRFTCLTTRDLCAIILAVGGIACAASPAVAEGPTPTRPAAAPRSLFDPARHMRVSEVHPGMTGYGLSVFDGTEIKRFDVQVVAVLHNFNPKYDVILIRCHGQNLEHTGPIEGMSGSPIFLHDGAGHDRMCGAFAYGWPLQKDPIAGVQPIEYMLNVGRGGAAATEPAPAFENGATSPDTATDQSDFLGPAIWTLPRQVPLGAPRSSLVVGDSSLRLQPLATPLETSGIPRSVLNQLQPILASYGMVAMQAGGGGGGTTTQAAEAPKVEPGSVLAVPLLGGDIDASAVGTCTERIGDHIFAFGHPLFGSGRVTLPISGGSIQAIIANLQASFKLGSAIGIAGTLQADQTVGIAGTLGVAPPRIPIDLRVRYADGSEDESYHFTCAVNPQLTPLLASIAIISGVTGERDLPQFHTLNYDLTLDFGNGRRLDIHNAAVNAGVADVVGRIGLPITGAANNPFEQVMVKSISGTVTVSPIARSAAILYATVPRSIYRPGDTVNAYVTYRPFHGEERVLPVSMGLPEDLPDGTYSLSISDAGKYLDDERTAEPFKFTAENIRQVFEVLRDAEAIQTTAVYIRLLRQPDGVAIGHTAMPKLPSSRREVMVGAGRSDTTEFVSSVLKVIPTAYVMNGSCDFAITIDHNADTELTPPTHPPHRDVRPTPKPAPAPPPPAGTPGGKPQQ